MKEVLTEAQAAELPEVPFEVPEGYRLLSDAEMEQVASQLVEDRRDKWEVQEIVDNAVVACEMNALLRNEFLYEFKQGGRDVRGLTASMITHLATAQGISEVTKEREHIEDDEKHEFEVVVEMPDPLNPDRMLKRTGFCEEPKMAYGKYDKFAKAKAHTKAFRNACMKLLPQDLIIATIYKLAKLVPADWTPRQSLQQPQQRALPAPKQNGTPAVDAREKARAAAFAKYKERKTDLEALGITEDIFKKGVYAHYKVKSSEDMTERQCRDLLKSLGGEFTQWVLDLSPSLKGAAESKPPSF